MDIELREVTKRFGAKTVLDGVSISLSEGQVNCLMGPSGSGKSTIVNILLGLLPIDSGQVIGMKNRKIAAVFQEDRLIEHWDALKNVQLVCDKSLTKEDILREFQQVGLEEDVDLKDHRKPVSLYSGGMRRRVTIVRALLAQSDIVILDEPFKGLDDALKLQVIAYVKQKTAGKTLLVVTHDKEEAQQLGGNMIILQAAV